MVSNRIVILHVCYEHFGRSSTWVGGMNGPFALRQHVCLIPAFLRKITLHNRRVGIAQQHARAIQPTNFFKQRSMLSPVKFTSGVVHKPLFAVRRHVRRVQIHKIIAVLRQFDQLQGHGAVAHMKVHILNQTRHFAEMMVAEYGARSVVAKGNIELPLGVLAVHPTKTRFV